MHDQTIEERLRATLRAEADGLPFTVTTDELQRRLTVRERERAGRRRGLLAAAIAALVVGGALVVAVNPFRATQVATTPQPSIGPSTPPASTVPATPVPSDLLLPSGAPRVDPALQYLNPDPDAIDDARTTIPGDPTSTETLPSGITLDPVRQSAREVGIKLVCIGPDRLTLSWDVGQGEHDTPTSIAAETIACDNTIATFRYDIAARQPLIADRLQIGASPRTSYRVLVETFGELNDPRPAALPSIASPGGNLVMDVLAGATTSGKPVGHIPARQAYRVALVCLGSGTATWSIGAIGGRTFVDSGEVPCDGTPAGVTSSAGLPSQDPNVYVRTDPANAWHLVITDPYGPGTFLPPALDMFSGPGLQGPSTSSPAHCIGYDGNGDSCGLDVTPRDGSRVIQVARGGRVSFRLADGWTIDPHNGKVDVIDREELRTDPTQAGSREFAFLNDGSPDFAASGDQMVLSLAGLDPGEWMLVVTISAEKGGHTFGATYILPVRIE